MSNASVEATKRIKELQRYDKRQYIIEDLIKCLLENLQDFRYLAQTFEIQKVTRPTANAGIERIEVLLEKHKKVVGSVSKKNKTNR